jgi:hypothetical protein
MFESLLALYEYLINHRLGNDSMKKLMMDYVMTCLIYESRNVRRKSLKVRMPPWCCNKVKVAIHFGDKT